MSTPDKSRAIVRPFQYRDLDAVRALVARAADPIDLPLCERALQPFERWRNAQDLWRAIPQPQACHLLVVEVERQLCAAIRVLPFNRARTTWQVEWTVSSPPTQGGLTAMDCGSQLLRHCFEKIVEASNWVLEVDVSDQSALGLYRTNGFQPLAQLTHWEVPTPALRDLSQHLPDLPSLLPVRNADAQLLYQLDTVSMPPLLRQVFDRQIQDFRCNLFQLAQRQVATQFAHGQVESYYVFEAQRKAAIGYYRLDVAVEGSHRAELTVHPAYTWLYPELMAQMARTCQQFNAHLPLQLISADYHFEREEYLQKIGAQRTAHRLLMSRSVWHKVRETKHLSLEGLQLSDMLSGLSPSHNPIPSRWGTIDPEE